MKCDDCGKNKAEYFLQKNVNNEFINLHLCKDCAEKKGLVSFSVFMETPLEDLVGSFLSAAKKDDSQDDAVCSSCGLTFKNLKDIGKLGCPKCYCELSRYLDPMLIKLHGTTRHRGKVPKNVLIENTEEELKRLKRELKKAIQLEDFEKAAIIRDKLRNIARANK